MSLTDLNLKEENGCVHIDGIPNFSLTQTFECGQCFRFSQKDGIYEGVVGGRLLRISQKDTETVVHGCSAQEFDGVWKSFLSLDIDYPAICNSFISGSDQTLSRASEYGRGIRILRQDRWEALCSFIISQNNNIPRIKKIINTLCSRYGDPVDEKGMHYSFPSPRRLAALSVEELYGVSMGFRAKYVYDAACKVSTKEIDFSYIDSLDTPSAMEYLCRIKGVGPKVALCTLLFGFERLDAFPVDVWVKKVLEKYYPDGACEALSGKYAGIAQQYLFYYERSLAETEKSKK